MYLGLSGSTLSFHWLPEAQNIPALRFLEVLLYLFTCNQRCLTNTPTIHGTHHFPGNGPEHSQSASLTSLLHNPDVITEEISKHEARKLKKKIIQVFCLEVQGLCQQLGVSSFSFQEV